MRKIQIVLLIVNVSFLIISAIDLRGADTLKHTIRANPVIAVPAFAVFFGTVLGIPAFLLREGYLWLFAQYTYSASYTAMTLVVLCGLVVNIIMMGLITERDRRL